VLKNFIYEDAAASIALAAGLTQINVCTFIYAGFAALCRSMAVKYRKGEVYVKRLN